MAFRTHLNGEQRESIEKRRSHAIRQNADGVIALAGERQARGKKKNRVDLQHQSRLFPARGLRL